MSPYSQSARGKLQSYRLWFGPSRITASRSKALGLLPVDFLPHGFIEDRMAGQTPVVLTTQLGGELPHRQILVNLSDEIPSHYTQFERVIEIVSTNNDDAQAARQRFRQYQHEGIQPSHTVANKS